MQDRLALVFAYLLGGITFLPLLAAAILLHAHFTFPSSDGLLSSNEARSDEGNSPTTETLEKLEHLNSTPSVAASYFAVCREYVPGGINGKPPERTTPAGETIASESPSVYQSMYRSIFDRNKTQVPSLEAGKPVKKARNVFYVVLRHGHLLLFNDENQVEVRHVVSLANYIVDLYAGGEDIPEGELFIKRNCIRLRRRPDPKDKSISSMPYYLFSENCSEKEDFYHTLLSQLPEDQSNVDSEPAQTLQYETDDMIKLVRQLHTADESQHSRWLNALLGRIFLAIYKTDEIEDFIRQKITKKITRIPKPNFITSLRLEAVHMGDSAPSFSNFKLREMNVDGGLTLEADAKYNGNFRIVIAATARIDLGTRFKAREVSLVLSGVLKRLEGHLLLKVKPPPSNRVWMTFESMPKVDLSVEPIVSSRQITYSVILRAIENRVREVIAETLVFPNWDDTPFLDTSKRPLRGGLWKSAQTRKMPPSEELVTEEPQTGAADAVLRNASAVSDGGSKDDAGVVEPLPPPPLSPHKRVASLPSVWSNNEADADADTIGVDIPTPLSKTGRVSMSGEKPKVLRSNSFATAAVPIISKTPSMAEPSRPTSRGVSQDAASAMKILHQRSPETSPVGSPAALGSLNYTSSRGSRSNSLASLGDGAVEKGMEEAEELPFVADELERQDLQSMEHAGPTESVLSSSPKSAHSYSTSQDYKQASYAAYLNKRASFNAQLNSATAAARNWGWNVIKNASTATPSRLPRSATQPMGRGQPLPPPGVPLPKPTPETWSAAAMNTMNTFKRKPVASPRNSLVNGSPRDSSSSIPRPSARTGTSPTPGMSSARASPEPSKSLNGQIPTEDILHLEASAAMLQAGRDGDSDDELDPDIPSNLVKSLEEFRRTNSTTPSASPPSPYLAHDRAAE